MPQTELTHEQKWAQVDAWLEEGRKELIAFHWKAAGRPHGPDLWWLPEDLRADVEARRAA